MRNGLRAMLLCHLNRVYKLPCLDKHTGHAVGHELTAWG